MLSSTRAMQKVGHFDDGGNLYVDNVTQSLGTGLRRSVPQGTQTTMRIFVAHSLTAGSCPASPWDDVLESTEQPSAFELPGLFTKHVRSGILAATDIEPLVEYIFAPLSTDTWGLVGLWEHRIPNEMEAVIALPNPIRARIARGKFIGVLKPTHIELADDEE